MLSRLEQMQAIDQAGRKLGEVLAQFLLQNQEEILDLYPGSIEAWSDEQMVQALLWCVQLLEQQLCPPTLSILALIPQVFADEKA